MPASDALIGEGLKDSPYAELSTKYEELSASYEKLHAELGERLSVREIETRGWPLSVEEWATKYQLLENFRGASAYDAQEARLETELARAERDAFSKAYEARGFLCLTVLHELKDHVPLNKEESAAYEELGAKYWGWGAKHVG